MVNTCHPERRPRKRSDQGQVEGSREYFVCTCRLREFSRGSIFYGSLKRSPPISNQFLTECFRRLKLSPLCILPEKVSSGAASVRARLQSCRKCLKLTRALAPALKGQVLGMDPPTPNPSKAPLASIQSFTTPAVSMASKSSWTQNPGSPLSPTLSLLPG